MLTYDPNYVTSYSYIYLIIFISDVATEAISKISATTAETRTGGPLLILALAWTMSGSPVSHRLNKCSSQDDRATAAALDYMLASVLVLVSLLGIVLK